MKKAFRIISLAIILAMFASFAASCGGGDISVTVSIKFIEIDENGNEFSYLTDEAFVVTGSDGKQPTALDAAQQVLLHYEKVYELTADGNSIAMAFDKRQEDSSDESYGYYKYWKFTLNGNDSSEGRQSATTLYDQDQLVFTWTEGQEARKDTVAVETTNPADYETEYVETKAPETTEEAE